MCVHIINGHANAVIAGQSICALISSQKTFLERHVDGTKLCVFSAACQEMLCGPSIHRCCDLA